MTYTAHWGDLDFAKGNLGFGLTADTIAADTITATTIDFAGVWNVQKHTSQGEMVEGYELTAFPSNLGDIPAAKCRFCGGTFVADEYGNCNGCGGPTW